MNVIPCGKLFLLCLSISMCLAKPVQDEWRDSQRYKLTAKQFSTNISDDELVLNLVDNRPGTFVAQIPPDVVCQASNDDGALLEYRPLNENGKYYDINTNQIIDSTNIIGDYQKVVCVNGLGHTICEARAKKTNIRAKRHRPNTVCKFPLIREEPHNPGAAGLGNGGNVNGQGGNIGNIQGQNPGNGQGGNNGNNQGQPGNNNG